MNNSKMLEFKIGILVIITLSIAISFILFMGDFKKEKGVDIYVDYTFSGAIKDGAAVKISGIKVGVVKKVEFRHGKKNKFGKNILVRLHLFIKNEYKDSVRENAVFYITTAGILGELYVEVNPGDFNRNEIADKSIVMGIAPPKMDLMLTQASQLLESASKLLNENGDLITDLLSELYTLTKSANSIIKENREKITSVLDSTDKLLINSVKLTDSANNIVGDGRKIKNMVSDLASITSKINKKLDPMLNTVDTTLLSANDLLIETNGFLKKNKDNIGELITNGVNLTNKTNKTLETTNKMLDDIYDGKGNIGKFLKGSEIYYGVKELVFTLKKDPWKVMWRGQ
jgi:phospholipid/cholesterol/gamma-HCH transport system substrate-binding protein